MTAFSAMALASGTCFLRTLKRVWQATQAQDLIEYALMAGFVAVAAGAIMRMSAPASARSSQRSGVSCLTRGPKCLLASGSKFAIRSIPIPAGSILSSVEEPPNRRLQGASNNRHSVPARPSR